MTNPKPDTAQTPPEGRRAARRTIGALMAGALLGLAAAALGTLEGSSEPALPEGIVARVGEAAIRVEEYERLVAGLENDRREPVDDALRRHVLERMIDEELLVQRAVELGLVEVDRRVRADLTSAMIQSIVSDAEDREPSERELRAFYADNADFFTQPGRLRVRQLFFRVPRDGSDDPRPAEAVRRLRSGEDFSELRTTLADLEVSPIPDAMLPPLKLREYIGPTALRVALELAPREVSDPVRSGMGHHVLELLDEEPARTPAFDEIREQVENEWRRKLGDRALRAYLDGLRDEIEVVTSLPER